MLDERGESGWHGTAGPLGVDGAARADGSNAPPRTDDRVRFCQGGRVPVTSLSRPA
ncbi:hypothetical protein F750_5196 [Streptomyces sp. PAMC 26508]|nr:hypothetical protein F750_5196 [Streptomyces sp. PAMC 26508]